jgi:hypothetical protein
MRRRYKDFPMGQSRRLWISQTGIGCLTTVTEVSLVPVAGDGGDDTVRSDFPDTIIVLVSDIKIAQSVDG